MFGPYKFKGLVQHRSINIYNTSLSFLKQNKYFKTIKISQNCCSFLIGEKGKTIRYYESDRSIKFHLPHSKIKNFNKGINVEIYKKDKKLANILDQINGYKRLSKNHIWFKAANTCKFTKSTEISINSRALGEYIHRFNIKSVYIDKRSNYVILKPTNLQASRNSFLSKVWINDNKVMGKVCFSIPLKCKIDYVCIDDKRLSLKRNMFQTAEEFELAKELHKNHNILCVSAHQSHDIKILNVNSKNVFEKTAINLKNIKNNNTTYYHIFSDILKGILYFRKNKRINFLVLNKEWKNYELFANYLDLDIIKETEKIGINLIFSDYKTNWPINATKTIESYLSSVNDSIASARLP